MQTDKTSLKVRKRDANCGGKKEFAKRHKKYLLFREIINLAQVHAEKMLGVVWKHRQTRVVSSVGRELLNSAMVSRTQI